MKPSLDAILSATASVYNVSLANLYDGGKRQPYAEARAMAAYTAVRCGFTLQEIGLRLGRNRSSVWCAYRKAAERIEIYAEDKKLYNKIILQIRKIQKYMTVKLKKLSPEAVIPRKAHPGDAAFDVFLPRHTVIRPGRQAVPLDIAIELPMWHQAMIETRSGFATNGMDGYFFIFENPQTGNVEYGARRKWDADVIATKVDEPYRGNIHVIINSHENRPFTIAAHTRLAQMTIYELPHIHDFEEVDDLSPSDRGENGICSTGTGA